jgi:hypothetical protein
LEIGDPSRKKANKFEISRETRGNSLRAENDFQAIYWRIILKVFYVYLSCHNTSSIKRLMKRHKRILEQFDQQITPI